MSANIYSKTEDGKLKETVPLSPQDNFYNKEDLIKQEVILANELQKVKDLLTKCDELGIQTIHE